jgi:excinuclease ABC subunit C
VRTKETLNSRLKQIPGIGTSRARALLDKFGSVAGVARASVEQLAGVEGFSAEMARKVVEYLNRGGADAGDSENSG